MARLSCQASSWHSPSYFMGRVHRTKPDRASTAMLVHVSGAQALATAGLGPCFGRFGEPELTACKREGKLSQPYQAPEIFFRQASLQKPTHLAQVE